MFESSHTFFKEAFSPDGFIFPKLKIIILAW